MKNTQKVNDRLSPRDQKTLCIDLDGTLIASDILWESCLILLKRRPFTFLLTPLWLIRGKAFFKSRIAENVDIDPTALPYRPEVLEFIHSSKDSRQIILATASHEKNAQIIAHHLDLFDCVIGTTEKKNLLGVSKLEAIHSLLDGEPFDYVGDSTSDIPIFLAANEAILVNASNKVFDQVSKHKNPKILVIRKVKIKAIIQSLRWHQWAKNILVFVPLIASHRIFNLPSIVSELYAFIAFCLAASSIYIFNDMIDIASDRFHEKKRFRPLASGQLSIPEGCVMALALLALSTAVSLALLPIAFSFWLLVYFLASNLYSLFLKQRLLVDVFSLTTLYMIRIAAGGAVCNISISKWLITFSAFFFLCLAFVKRFTEVSSLISLKTKSVPGRGYLSSDIEILRVVGPVSGYVSIVILALYINSPEVTALYNTPVALWLACPIIAYWLTRIWFIANRGELHHDPVAFAITDRISYYIVALIAGIIAFSCLYS